jgi:hypothetical protein
MTDRSYGYFTLELFDGAIVLPLKFCTSYPGEDKLRANAVTKTGLKGRATNRVYVLPKEGLTKVNEIDDIECVIPWGSWETYIPGDGLEPLENYPGLKELLEQDKLRSKERNIEVLGIHDLDELSPFQYTGRHFHTYPHTAKNKDSPDHHNLYRLLSLYLEDNNAFVLCRYFSKGEELGAIYSQNNIIRVAGLHSTIDLKPVQSILKFDITKGFKRLAYEKFDKLFVGGTEGGTEGGTGTVSNKLTLEWRDYMRETLEAKGVFKKKSPISRKTKKTTENLAALFENI